MIVEKAYAKINTYLNVISKREDGYHNIVSIMQTVSLHDLVTVDFSEASETSIVLSVAGNDGLPVDRSNLAWRAAEVFLKKMNATGLVQIAIEKRIPMAAGLAGGSADAAAVLRALYKVFGSPFPLEELYSLGATLGADVPFCIRGGCCLVEGIGEKLKDAPTMPMGYLVIARMGDGVSTPQAYRALDEIYGDFSSTARDERYRRVLCAWEQKDLFGSCDDFFNLFEAVVSAMRPWVGKIKSEMTVAGAKRAMMSGSGPSVFGVFASESAAENACAALRDMGVTAFVCSPCGRYALS
ncbi:MAG: 4-(cytidine 5'-diphospho)-2-C-methyl-D-erythritol kinase [Ruminococcaceae bacterium]|nr:4-(cytidine 5'-diphospho)-2-C-methyl-D-erythritol kinase [Oscillospiraceae bacterium]